MLRSSYILLFCSFIHLNVFGQLIEAESRSYRFKIDMMMELESKSITKAFHILPYKVQISNILESELAGWYNENEISTSEKVIVDELVVGKVDEFLPKAIQEVGTQAMGKSVKRCFFIEKSLQFEIQILEFKSFKIGIPLAEVESFKNNFNSIEYSNQQIALNDNHEFVVTYLHIYNPTNRKKYIFYNTEDKSVQAPSFSISLPKTDL